MTGDPNVSPQELDRRAALEPSLSRAQALAREADRLRKAAAGVPIKPSEHQFVFRN